MRCLIEVRTEGLQPIVVSHQAHTIEVAVRGAIHKINAALNKVLEDIHPHH